MPSDRYDHVKIEKEARKKWAALSLYETNLSDPEKEPYYLLTEFPYPSGDLHIGHWYAFSMPDIFARMLRLQGRNVLFPFGFDSFGLPAENAAIKNKVDPKEWTYANIERMQGQVETMGLSVDWSKKVITSDPEYYRWTQWLFTKMFEHDLAYKKKATVNWDPVDMTVLANEQILSDGTAERSGALVEKRELEQWFLKITDYADRLIDDLEPLDWPSEIKDAQIAWIGRSEGSKLRFVIADSDDTIEVFTTRPDTLYGVTYVVLAPEHPLVETLLDRVQNRASVEAYVAATARKSERERMENKEKTGVVLEGVQATNPVNGERVPVCLADYVLPKYGTGAVMAVPAHDERDFAFATKFGLPVRQVVMPRVIDAANPHRAGKETVAREGVIAIVRNSADDTYLCLKWTHESWTTFVTGGVEPGETPLAAAMREIQEETGYQHLTFVRSLGVTQSEFFASHKDVNRVARTTSLLFELADTAQVSVTEDEAKKHTPVWLSKEEVEKTDMRHGEFTTIWRRALHGMDASSEHGILIDSGAFSGSESASVGRAITEAAGGERMTTYRLRDWLVSRQRYWGCPIPIVYDPAGKPHAIPAEHLPWTLPTDVDFTPTGRSPLASSVELQERVTRLFGEGWTPEYDTLDVFVDSSWYYLRYLAPHDDARFSSDTLMRDWLPIDRYSGGSEHTTVHVLYARFFYKALYDLALVPTAEPFVERFNRGLIMGTDGQKMSKRWGNVVNPDEMVATYGADAVRLYLAFIGPYNEPGSYPWNLDGVVAMRKFLDRIVRLSERVHALPPGEQTSRALAKAIQKVETDGARFKFNTAVSGIMVLVKELESLEQIPEEAYRSLLILLSPFAPHLAECLYSARDWHHGKESIHQEAWPLIEERFLTETLVSLSVSVGGKHRGIIQIAPDAGEAEVVAAARGLEAVARALGGAEPSRTIYVPGKVLNFVP